MTIDKKKYSLFLERFSQEIDIPPNKYKQAVDRYEELGRWLEIAPYPGTVALPSIYPQGSFRLGTVVRPIRKGIEADYDIDLVCELQILKHQTQPREVKTLIGERIKEHKRYGELLDIEGKRCWTLVYSEEDEIGFHIDVLPAIPEHLYDPGTSIAITNKQSMSYEWSSSDPKGYGKWFDSKNQVAFDQVSVLQKQYIQSREPTIYASIDRVPDELVRTPLQRSIQIIKRHRDMHFSDGLNEKFAPISIVISTLAALLYENESDIANALTKIVSRLHAHSELVENRPTVWAHLSSDLITRTPDGRWYIGNPVNADENFADRWHEDGHARARAFFSWVESLKRDLIDVVSTVPLATVHNRLKSVLGTAAVTPHLALIVPELVDSSSVPEVSISSPTKPWGELYPPRTLRSSN
ncbi:MAG: nucleotidyltransferase [Gammaproteobacteria bacterium]|nr:nucleotidyltransferase [Gammaproteobacteria bacterium]